MVYMGSKNRLAKELIPIITADLEEGMWYVEPFVGGCNMIDKIQHPLRLGADSNEYLMALLKYVQAGGVLPEHIDKEEYLRVKANPEGYDNGTLDSVDLQPVETVYFSLLMLVSAILSKENGTTLKKRETIYLNRIYLGLNWSAVAMISWRYQIIPLSIATLLIRLPLAIRMLLIVLSSGNG